MCQGCVHVHDKGEGSRTVEEGNKLLPSAFGAKGEGDGGETSDGVETKDDIVVLSGRNQWVRLVGCCGNVGSKWEAHTFSSSMSTAMG